MTVSAIKQAFGRMDSTEKAVLLKELASSLAEGLAADDAADARVFAARRAEERRLRPWSEVRRQLAASSPRSRKRAR